MADVQPGRRVTKPDLVSSKTLDDLEKRLRQEGAFISRRHVAAVMAKFGHVEKGSIYDQLPHARKFGDIQVVDSTTIRLSSAARNYRKDVYHLHTSTVVHINPQTGERTTETVIVCDRIETCLVPPSSLGGNNRRRNPRGQT